MNEFPYPLILYDKALMPHDWPRMFYETAELGFQGLELSVDESDARLARLDWSDRTCLCVARAAKEAGVRLQSLCFSGQRRFPMGSEDPDLPAGGFSDGGRRRNAEYSFCSGKLRSVSDPVSQSTD